MRQPACMLVDREGVVVRMDAQAERLLGAHTGSPCRTLVHLVTEGGASPCRVGCSDAVTRGQAGPEGAKGRIATGDRATLRCSRMGDEVLVSILPASEPLLTPRECQILGLVAQGHTNDRIARRLQLSPSTVRTHLEHIRAKLGARTRAEAVHKAIQAGMLEG